MIDGHIHYASMLNPRKLNELIRREKLGGVALQCIPKADDLPVEEDAFAFAAQAKVPVYVFGGLRRELYRLSEPELSGALVREAERLMDRGCAGIKMLEGKPQIRKAHPIPDFDRPVWEPYWSLLEERQIPVYFHVNDPEEFWDPEKISKHALESGWLYDETFINNEEQYRQVLAVLERHPGLRIVFPHFFFFSGQLDRLRGIMEAFEEVRIDVTPGIELYYNLSGQPEAAKKFFGQFQDRILYGTDSGAGEIVRSQNEELSLEDALSRMKLIRDFLETEGTYTLYPDGYYVKEGPRQMQGLGLSPAILQKIYETNFLELIGERKKGRTASTKRNRE